MPVAESIQDADLVMMLAPDEFQKGIYDKSIQPNLKSDAILAFAHGFNIHFEKIVPEKGNSVIMIAPKGPGHTVRSTSDSMSWSFWSNHNYTISFFWNNFLKVNIEPMGKS